MRLVFDSDADNWGRIAWDINGYPVVEDSGTWLVPEILKEGSMYEMSTREELVEKLNRREQQNLDFIKKIETMALELATHCEEAAVLERRGEEYLWKIACLENQTKEQQDRLLRESQMASGKDLLIDRLNATIERQNQVIGEMTTENYRLKTFDPKVTGRKGISASALNTQLDELYEIYEALASRSTNLEENYDELRTEIDDLDNNLQELDDLITELRDTAGDGE